MYLSFGTFYFEKFLFYFSTYCITKYNGKSKLSHPGGKPLFCANHIPDIRLSILVKSAALRLNFITIWHFHKIFKPNHRLPLV